MGWWRGPANVEFIKMKGPAGKGHAEMAITQHRGLEERCGLEDSENSDWQDYFYLGMGDLPYKADRCSSYTVPFKGLKSSFGASSGVEP